LSFVIFHFPLITGARIDAHGGGRDVQERGGFGRLVTIDGGISLYCQRSDSLSDASDANILNHERHEKTRKKGNHFNPVR